MRELLEKIRPIKETTDFFKAFTAKSPDGEPRGRLLMSNTVRSTKEKLKPVMVALNDAFRAMYDKKKEKDIRRHDWIPLPLFSKSSRRKKASGTDKTETSRRKRTKNNRENANIEVIHDTATQSRHAIILKKICV